MITSEAGRQFIKDFESSRLTVYDDGFQYPTVGYGHKITQADDLELGDTITQDVADAFFADDLQEAEAAVNIVGVDLEQHEFDALVSLVWNIGVGAWVKSTLRKMLPRSDRAHASEQFPRWNKVKGVVVEGLVKRRRAERELFLSGIYDAEH